MNQRRAKPWWTRWSSYLTANLRAGWLRMTGALVPTIQAAIAATIAWLICHHLLGDPSPIFAPIATLVCMGLSRNRELRKVAEMGFGASTGVLLGGLVAQYWGFGAWQLLLMFLIIPLVGRLIDRSEMVAFQMAIQSVVVASMMTMAIANSKTSTALDRWLSALVGAGVALLATVILPTNVVTRPRRYLAFSIQEIARNLRRMSKSLLDGNFEDLAQQAGSLAALREMLNDARRALTSAQETAAVSPSQFGYRQVLAELDRMLGLAERLHVTLSMLQRQARGMVAEIGPMPELAGPMWHAADLMEQVSKGVADWQRPTAARNEAVALASSLGPADIALDTEHWRTAALTSLLRAVVVDLLELTGLSMAQARAVLADTGDYQPETDPVAEQVEQASAVWGTEQLPVVYRPSSAEPDDNSRGS